MCPAQNHLLIQFTYLLIRFAEECPIVENRDSTHKHSEATATTVESKSRVKIAVDQDV